MVLKAQNFQFSTNVALAYNSEALCAGALRLRKVRVEGSPVGLSSCKAPLS
jgi:hypothetical protein